MIKLNQERGIIRVETVDDIRTMPGFTERIDPERDGHKLREIIGSYEFSDEVHCGLPCNQPHNRGYVAVTDQGAIILLGNQCGKRTFGLDFQTYRAAFVREINAKERREIIERTRNQLPALRQRVRAIRDAGATRFYALGQALRGSQATAPASVRRVLDDLIRTGRAIVMGTRPPTDEERVAYEAANGRKPPPGYELPVEYGRLAGLGFFSPDLDLRKLLIDEIEATLTAIEKIDIEKATDKELAAVARTANQLSMKFERVDTAMGYARAFFTQANLAPLRRVIRGQYEKQAFEPLWNQFPS